MKYTVGKYFFRKMYSYNKIKDVILQKNSINLSCKMVKNSLSVSPQYQNMQFETAMVLDALRNERNLTLVSSNNSKRADLIHEAFGFLKEREEAITLILPTHKP